MKKLLPILLFTILFSGIVFAQPGSNDPAFNPMDVGFGNGDGLNERTNISVIQPDGKVLLGGVFTSFNGKAVNNIVRLNGNGTVDSSFNSAAASYYQVKAIALQTDGKILVGTDVFSRLNSDGSIDTTFNSGTGFNGIVNKIVIQNDGKIIVAGDLNGYNGTPIYKIARLNTNGTLDSTFYHGIGFSNQIRSVAIQSDNKIIVGGDFQGYNGNLIARIARINFDGTLDTTFNPGTGFNNVVSTVAIQDDGKILAGGIFTTFNGITNTKNKIARLNTDGSEDASFTAGFNNDVSVITLQTDGKIIVGGNFTTYYNTTNYSINRIIRLNSNGSIDNTFDPGTGVESSGSGNVYSASIQSDGKIVIGGSFSHINGITRNNIARVNSNATVDLLFNTGSGANFAHINQPYAFVVATAVQSDDKILVGGNFTLFNGKAQNHITRLNPEGTLDTTFNIGIGFNERVKTIAIQLDGKIVVGGYFTSFNGTPLNYIARLNSDGTLDSSFNPGTGFYGFVYSITIQNDGKIIVGGDYQSFNGIARNMIVRLNVDGSLDTSFNPGTGFSAAVHTTVMQSDGKIMAGGRFNGFNGTMINGIARLNSDGSIDTTFNVGSGFSVSSSDIILSIAMQSDGKIIVGGGCSSFNGTTIPRVVRLNTNGSLDTTFYAGTVINWSINSVAVQSNGKILAGGGVESSGTTGEGGLYRLLDDGTVDPSFTSVVSLPQPNNVVIFTTSIQSDGKIITGGKFTSFNAVGRNRITRLFGDPPPAHSYKHNIKGYLFGDQNNDCQNLSSEPSLSYTVATVPNYSYAYSDTTGLYSLGIEDSVNYLIKPIIPQRFQHMVSNPCPADYTVILDASHPQDTAGFDFGFDYNPCYQLRVDVSSNRRRRCFKNITSVYYSNEGIIPANGVEVIVKMPEYVVPVSASLPYTWNTNDSTMIFNIGTLNDNSSGNITIIDSVACINGIFGLTQCTEAWITPPNSCIMNDTVGSGWDKSSVMVEASCLNDTVVFVIYNTGDPGIGDMDGTSVYRIYANNALMQSVPFQLNGGDSLIVTVVSGGATIRLEADQRPGHPGNSQPRETIEACGTDTTGTFTIGMVNLASQDDEDLHVEIDCLPIIDSYDPNDKKVTPAGIGPDRIVLPGTLLDFKIRFQNTGTDTAYKVVVIDTLSSFLDISTLELGTSSFPYSFSMSGTGKPILTFTFDNINLTDTITSEINSHGFVKLKIAPFDTVPLGTLIENFADIYFDYNYPIQTNTTVITIDSLNYTTSDLAIVVNQPFLNSFYCNGDSVGLEAVFTGNNLNYQWYKDSIAITGETSQLLNINPVVLADEGSYYCLASGHLNSIATISAILDVREHSFKIINETACESYSLNGQSYTSTGTYTQTLINSTSCDSTITLNLTINTVNTTVDQNNVMFTATPTGALYQWLNCDNNFSVLVGETNQSYTASTDGNYAVIVTQNNCSDTSSCYTITGTSIEENTSGNRLVIYPNPTNGNITLVSDLHLNKARVKIISLTGQVIFEKGNLNGNSFKFDISNEARGIYFMEIMHKDAVTRLKLILN